MNIFTCSANRKWLILGLCVQIVTAWCSLGYHHPDEHFQLLEYCNYKMGRSPAAALPWEFSEKCRPGLQPFIAYCLFKPLQAAGIFNPFAATFFLRLLMGVFTWWVTCRLLLLLLPQFKTDKGKEFYVLFSFFLWYVPYLGVRFSTENLSGLLFFLALSLMLEAVPLPAGKRTLRLGMAGLLLGFTLFLRLQMAFAYAGLGVWMLFIQKWHWRDWLILLVGGPAACGLSACADRWLYGAWVFTPYNYYYVNIVLHKADGFGIYPWWYYFQLFSRIAVPPISIALILLFFAGIYKKPLHLFTCVCVAFLIGHFAIGHKEMRFLFPMTFAFIFICCAGLDYLLVRFPGKRFYKWLFGFLAIVNCLLLAVRMLTPAQEMVNYYRFIYSYDQHHSTPLVSLDKSPYNADGLEENFYKPDGLKELIIAPGALPGVLDTATRPLLFFSPSIGVPPAPATCKTELLYCLFPDWLLYFNINNWEERSRIWAIYKIYPAHQREK